MTQPQGLTGTRDWEVSTVDGNRIVLTPTEAGAKNALKNSLTVARDVVRRRIDPGGTKEITVINQGERRIFVQVPGVEDPEALKQLIGQTARLEFKLVDLNADPAQVAAGRAPAGQPGAADGRRHRRDRRTAPRDGFGRATGRCHARASTRTAGQWSTSPSMPPALAASAG